MSGSREVSWMWKYSFCKRAGKYLAYVRHGRIQVGAHTGTQIWSRNSLFLLPVVPAVVNWWQMQTVFAGYRGWPLVSKFLKTKVKGSEDKSCKDNLSPTLHLLLFGKNIPQQSFPPCVCAAECKTEVGICITCGLCYFYKNRQLITFGIVLTPAHWDLPNMRSIKKIKNWRVWKLQVYVVCNVWQATLCNAAGKISWER